MWRCSLAVFAGGLAGGAVAAVYWTGPIGWPGEMTMLLSVRERFHAVQRRYLPELVAPHRVALANALAAVDRDRRAAAQRALGERLGDFDSVVALLGGAVPAEMAPAEMAQPPDSRARTASMVSASAGVLSGR